jgi:hypothetical protein
MLPAPALALCIPGLENSDRYWPLTSCHTNTKPPLALFDKNLYTSEQTCLPNFQSNERCCCRPGWIKLPQMQLIKKQISRGNKNE